MRRLIPFVLAAGVLTGCSTLGTDTVASVGGATLSRDAFEEMVHGDAGDVSDSQVVAGDTARQQVTGFVLGELLRQDLEALGQPVPETDSTGMSPSAARDAEFQALVQAWIALPPETMIDDRVTNFYESGAAASGVICPSHIVVPSEAEADEVIADLEAGTGFGDIAAERSIDDGSAEGAGALGCYETMDFSTRFLPEFATAALDAEIGEFYGPVQTEFGWHVIYLPPVDELPDNVIVSLRVRTLSDRYPVVIDPTIGQWDPAGQVVPVG